MSTPSAASLLFVYGSLKRGEFNVHHLGAGATFLDAARTVPGYQLFNLGSFPGLVPWPEDRDGVTGEVWSIPAENFSHLDAFEGAHLELYRRAPIRLQPPFADHAVETYIYARSIEGCQPLGSTWIGPRR